jgi:methylmalonyl-CoA mutase cobalamin-binding subunit
MQEPAWRGRRPLVTAEWVEELERSAAAWVAALDPDLVARIAARRLTACIGTTDVHEHGKSLVERVFTKLGVTVVDGGVSVDPEALTECAIAAKADLIAISTYNGIALRYARDVLRCLEAAGVALPVLIGGRLNEVPEDSNSGLPVDVGEEIRALGVTPCPSLDPLAPVLARLAGS